MIKTMKKRQVKFRQWLLGVNKKSLWCTSLVTFLKYNSGPKLKIHHWSKCMISSTNKEKQGKRENRAKKQRLNGKKKNDTRKQKMRRRRESNPVRLQVQATPWPLHHTETHLFEAGRAVLIINSIIHLRKVSLRAYFKAISHYFGLKGPTRCR